MKDFPEKLKEIIRDAKEEFEYLGVRDLRKVKKIKEKLIKSLC